MNECGKRNYDIHNFTHNFWMGCRRYSDGCKNCHMWLRQAERGADPSRIYRCTDQTAYGAALKLQRKAEAAGRVYTVTACSYSDFFLEEADAWRDGAWAVMKQTPNLVWHLVTKRAENIADNLPADWGTGYRERVARRDGRIEKTSDPARCAAQDSMRAPLAESHADSGRSHAGTRRSH